MALPDRDAQEDIRSVSAASPVVMFAGTDDAAFACEAILMKDRKLTEPDACRWLQKKAMNESRGLARIVADFGAAHQVPQRAQKP